MHLFLITKIVSKLTYVRTLTEKVLQTRASEHHQWFSLTHALNNNCLNRVWSETSERDKNRPWVSFEGILLDRKDVCWLQVTKRTVKQADARGVRRESTS